MAQLGGLRRSAKREIRYLDSGFYGLGFPHWGIESLIEAYKKFYVHYGTSSVLGVQLQTSVENFVIEQESPTNHSSSHIRNMGTG
jgi:hypothetical protein